jgi:hypothetical protein
LIIIYKGIYYGYQDFIKHLETVSVDELIPQTGIDFKTIKQAAS